MTLATTRAKIVTCLTGAGCHNVHSRVRTDVDRADVETAELYQGALEKWEIVDRTEAVIDGCDGGATAELEVEILAHWKHDDANDSRGAFLTQLRAVALALLDRTSGFVQVKEPGVQMIEFPEQPVVLPSRRSGYRARLRFRLWNVTNT